MHSTAFFLVPSLLTGLVRCQNVTITINPSTVALSTRKAWCKAQENTCPIICGGRANPNYCEPATLDYVCVCTDHSHPNISNFAQTIPSYVCEQWKAGCIAEYPNKVNAQEACLAMTCGSRNASTVAQVVQVSSSSSQSASYSRTSARSSSTTSISSSTSAVRAKATSTKDTLAPAGTGHETAIGIGVGIGVGCGALVAIAASLLVLNRRKKRAKRSVASTDGSAAEKDDAENSSRTFGLTWPFFGKYELNGDPARAELHDTDQRNPPAELSAEPKLAELNDESRLVELSSEASPSELRGDLHSPVQLDTPSSAE